ncbi:MAG: hypothetical protein KKG21_00525 [Candidatus Omnitrophica bacterium]|nr:hypothetical protein [Candidatus Omnitrophota bacterium]
MNIKRKKQKEQHLISPQLMLGALRCKVVNIDGLSRDSSQNPQKTNHESRITKSESELGNWPVQLMLVPTQAPYLKDADLLIAADCTAFSYPDFHQDFLKGRVLLLGCPKLDAATIYEEKLAEIFKVNNIKSITVLHMEVPCCFGLIQIVNEALRLSGKKIPLKEVTIGIKGDVK